MSTFDIHKRYVLNHPRERVFDIWISPDAVVAPVTAIEVELREQGVFKLVVDGEPVSLMIGKFLEFSRPSTLVYTWEWNHDGEVSQVHVAFQTVEQGTEIVIDHTGFDSLSSRETHDQGWDSYIVGIKNLLDKNR